jgi:hypothetical protein
MRIIFYVVYGLILLLLYGILDGMHTEARNLMLIVPAIQ